MQMTEADIKAYFRTWEVGTLATMESWAGRSATDSSFYGRNSPTVAGTCNANRAETWHPTGYGSTAAILDMAKRWGSGVMLQWLANNVELCLDVIPWWFASKFGKPPGEDSKIPGICGTTEAEVLENNWHGDTDIKRHYNAYGLFRAMVDADVMALGSWSYDDVVGLADTHYEWISGRAAGLYENPQQYLRYGNDLDSLCGMIDAYKAAGDTTKAANAYAVLAAFIYVIFADSKKVIHEGADGSEWADFNYGHHIEEHDEWEEPFTYGFYPFGAQAWYRGHLLVALKHAMEQAVAYSDTTLYAFCLNRYLALSKWIDPTERINAPLAPYTDACSTFFHNSQIGGGFVDPSRGGLLLSGYAENSLADWAAVSETSTFYRFGAFCSGVGGWKSDGGYWETAYIDKGGVEHLRRHNSGGSRQWTPHLPGIETANWYACLDAIWYRAELLSDATLKDLGRIALFHQLAFANSSDKVKRLNQRLANGLVEGANLVGKPARQWHWSIQAGWMQRSDEVTV